MRPFSVIIPTYKHNSPERERLLEWVIARYLGCFDEATIILGEDDSVPFNRARARNNAFKDVATENVIIADGDTAFDPGAITIGLAMLEGGAPWVIPYGDKDYYNLTEAYTQSILDNPMDLITEPVWDHRIKSWAGLLIARTEDCRSVGGYDETFEGWGWEDIAFRIKMDAHVGRHQRVPDGRALHLWHLRGEDEFRTPTELKNRDHFDRSYRVPYNWRDERIR
jgi:hypothetical protein